MAEVQIFEAKRPSMNSKNRAKNRHIVVEKIRVAAYCRVSTDDEEQLGSFESQRLYYEEKIAENPDWINAGIFSDEAITGTKTDKRKGFQNMIQMCLEGEIDLILTKSISRFARNTLDTLQYVRLLKEKNIGIFFEKENIYTLDMQGEMLLTILSSLAQQEVESLSKNVKLGLQMKMSRGELIGFNGCYGYDYHPEDKSITVNQEEAEVIKLIFEMYSCGYGSDTISKRLREMGIVNRKSGKPFSANGIIKIVKNEKYKGDILMGKTFTTDPISKRRLTNLGEENQYYTKDHHEPIVSRALWDECERIRLKRGENRIMESSGNREVYTRKYAFSSMCECGYCGHKLSRRTRHSNSKYSKTIWQCMNAVKNGIKACPNCKSSDEAVLESAFLEMFQLLAKNFEDVLDIVLDSTEEILNNMDVAAKIKQIDKDIVKLEARKNRMTDVLLDGTIDKEDYETKKEDINKKLKTLSEQRRHLDSTAEKQKDINKRMSQLRKTLEANEVLDEFDRTVFDSIVEKVIVGGYDENGQPDPYKLTFVLKGEQQETMANSKEHFKKKKKGVS